MKNKVLSKILALMIILMLISTDFCILGFNLISYAEDIDSVTNNNNIGFSVYFKDDSGKKVSNIAKSIKNENIKLYVQIQVKNEGYFNGKIVIENSNFNVKSNSTSSYISKIENNTIMLNQINADSTVEIELEIEPKVSDKVSIQSLNQNSSIRLTGTYMEKTYKGIEIDAVKSVKLNFDVDESAQAELKTEIITNKIFTVNNTNKRIVQLLVKSRLAENQYPIKQTVLNINIPKLGNKLPEEIEVLSLGTNATNGNEDGNLDSWKKESDVIQIFLNNDPNENNEINWKKNVYDEVIITFIYDENVDASKVEIKSSSQITLYNLNNKYTAEHTVGIENKELNNTIMSQTQIISQEMYKGQLYANVKSTEKKNIPFSTNTILQIRNSNIADNIAIKEEKDLFSTGTAELNANTKYIKTEINKEKMLKILGDKGKIKIKNGKIEYDITKDSVVDENGNIVINYDTDINELEIIISDPIEEGTLEIIHYKEIMENSYTTEQIKQVKSLKTKNVVKATLEDKTVIENTNYNSEEIKETISKAELTVNRKSFSTINDNKEVILGIKLDTSDVRYDLYKNPTINIKLPQTVEDVKVNSIDKLYGDEFNISAIYNKANKCIDITLKGEQLSYPETLATQLYLQINLDIKLSKMAPSKTDKIIMTYTNQNASQYEGGSVSNGNVEKNIEILSPNGLVTMNNLKTYNVLGIPGISENSQNVIITKSDSGKELVFEIGLINNTKENIKNVRILGKLPTDGNKIEGEDATNTLQTSLNDKIILENAEIYYTENTEATSDINNKENGWTSNLKELNNAKMYLIVIKGIDAENNFVANYTVKLPDSINNDLKSYTEYKVIYDTEIEKNIEINSTKIGIESPTSVKIETNIIAEVGNDKLNNGDIVKSGEVIKYTVTVKNNGTQTIENVMLKSGVPEGTVVVVPEDDYTYTGTSYYEEKPEIKEMIKESISIESGKTYSFEYEVRVKTDIQNNKEIINKSIATCGETTVESGSISNKLETSKIRVTIKRTIDLDMDLVPGSNMKYLVFVENLSEEDVKDVELKILTENVDIEYIMNNDIDIKDIPETIKIKEIPAKGNVYFQVGGKIESDVEQIKANAIVEDKSHNIYRSNKSIENLAKIGAKIQLSSPSDGGYIEKGDYLEYAIVVENTGDITENITISDKISDYLEIQEISVNGEVKSQIKDSTQIETYSSKISNNIFYILTLQKNEKAQMIIKMRVKDFDENFEVENITNKAEAIVYGEVKGVSNEITHMLKGNSLENLKNIISGTAWLDKNLNGEKDNEEDLLSGIKVKLYDVATNNYLLDKNGNIIETITNDKGEYIFTKIKDGQYIILFEYDTNKYEPTIYKKDGVDESKTSKVVSKNISINGQEKNYAVTDKMDVLNNISNINIGLKQKVIYDLELNKYISKIVVQNNKGTKTYNYKDSTFEKVEIHAKDLKNTTVVLEYKIKVKNNGEITGQVNSIVDYLPSGLTFSSELNPQWYLSGNNLYSKALSKENINPGEEKEITLILTKSLTEDNIGLINNRAEIHETYNEYGIFDIDSNENNQVKGEDDLGSADVIISIKTGGTIIAYIILLIINTVLITIAVRLILKNTKREKIISGRR